METDPIKDAIANLMLMMKVDKIVNSSPTDAIKKALLNGTPIPTALTQYAERIKESVSSLDDRQPRITKLSDIKMEQSRYLWAPYVPCESLTTLVADGGTGKGTLCNYFMYLATTGQLNKLGRTDIHEPIPVLYSSIEDDPSKKTLPQIELYGGNKDLIGLCSDLKNGDEFTFDDMDVMRQILSVAKPQWWIIDHAGDFGSDNDGNNYKAVGRELKNLTKLSTEFKLAIFLMVHTNRGGTFMGSNAYKTKPRSVLTLKTTSEENQTILQHLKTNDRKGPPVLFNAQEFDVQGQEYPVWQVAFGGLASVEAIAEANDKEVTKQRLLEHFVFHLLGKHGAMKFPVLKQMAEAEFGENPKFKKDGQFAIHNQEWARLKKKLKLNETVFGFSLPAPVQKALGTTDNDNLRVSTL